MTKREAVHGEVDGKMLVTLVAVTSVLLVVIVTILCCYYGRKCRKKEVMKFEYSEDSDKQPFVVQADASQVETEVRDLESGTNEPPRETVVTFDEVDIGKLNVVSSPLKRIKSYTLGGCSPKGLAKEMLKKRSASEDYRGEKEEQPPANFDSLQQENCIYDSFTKLKNIYDYQKSRYVDETKTHSMVEIDSRMAADGSGRIILESDRSFDRVKELYDRVTKSMVLERQPSVTDSNSNVYTVAAASNENQTEVDECAVFIG